MTLSSSALNFGSVTVNSAATGSVTLTSSGNSALTVNSASITGAGFTIAPAPTFPVSLAPNESLTLQLKFLPTAAGAAAGHLTISSNSASGSTATVALSGTGTAAANPQLSLSTSSLSFGSVNLNTTASQSLTLNSTGTSPVTVNSASVAGGSFTIAAATLPATLNPGQSMTLQLQFKPTAAGSATGSVTISSNSTTGSTAVVSLSGTGTTSNPQLTVSSTTLNFGNVTVNNSTTQSVTLTSTGTAAVTVNAASISGSGFTLVGGSFPLTLNPSQSTTLQVQFKPAAAGAVTGNLTISSNSTANGTAAVSLSGTGMSVPHEVDLSWSAPGSSPDPVVGYHIYRSTAGGPSQLINTSIQTPTNYVDSTVVSGSSYNYMVKSVDSTGVESVPSNEVAVTIP